MIKKLESMGYNDWFVDKADPEKVVAHELARVISVHKDSYVVSKGQGEAFAELLGSFFYTANASLDFPTTGDWVYADFYDDDSHAIIHGVLPRKTLLKRKTAGKLVDFQLIGANIDTAFIVQSVDCNLNLRRLERYLVMVNESKITPVILLSKCDLVSEDELSQIKKNILSIAPQTQTLAFSNLSCENIDEVKKILLHGCTYCLLGSSGVGKTSLLNSLLGEDRFETQSVSVKQNKGRHTTTSRDLMRLESGAMLIDTPGMRELGNMSVDDGLDETFSEILALTQNCKFSNCSHTREKGCSILAAIAEGELTQERYKNYLKMKNESAFNEMSYAEKRRKDKDFGRLIKSTVKGKKRW